MGYFPLKFIPKYGLKYGTFNILECSTQFTVVSSCSGLCAVLHLLCFQISTLTIGIICIFSCTLDKNGNVRNVCMAAWQIHASLLISQWGISKIETKCYNKK